MSADGDVIDTILDRLRQIVPADVEVRPDSAIMGDLGLDSLAVMNFVMWLEDTFDVSVPMDRIVEVETVADLARVLQSLRNGGK